MLLPSILVFLFPIAIYCWILAGINRRPQPTMVSGVWDCAGMLLAASGILLMVGPFLLSRLFDRIEDTLPLDRNLADEYAKVEVLRWIDWILYYIVVSAGVVLLLWWRRNRTEIYNVDPEQLVHALVDSLERLGLQATRAGKRLFIAAKPPDLELLNATVPDEGSAPVQTAPVAPPRATPTYAELSMEVFPSMCNVSLHWRRADGDVRANIERDLQRHLDRARTFENPVANWLLGLTGMLFGLIFLDILFLIMTHFFLPRRW